MSIAAPVFATSQRPGCQAIAPGIAWQRIALPDGLVARVCRIAAARVTAVRPVLFSRPAVLAREAARLGAVVAINGGYFDHADGVPASYLIWGDRVLADPHKNALLVENPRLGPYLSAIFRRSALIWSAPGAVPTIRPLTGVGVWGALQAGPSLLPVGALRRSLRSEAFIARSPSGALVRDPLGAYRDEPRSAVGLASGGELVLVAVPGDRAHRGMTLPGLAALLAQMGCSSAIALDGGSSCGLYAQLGGHGRECYPPAGPALIRSALMVFPSPRHAI